MLFARLLRPFVTVGTLRIIDAGGLVHTIRGHDPGPDVTMRLHNRRVQRRLLWRPAMAVGEAYMDGSLTVDGGDVYPLLDLINRNTFRAGYNPLVRLHHALAWPVRLLSGSNSLKRARRNAAYTYDLDAEFYRLFLDKHMQYTCAYFVKRDMRLDDAQEEKMLHLAAKLLLKPGGRVLDIGCGWGNLAAFLAGLESLSVDGLTLSQEQLRDAERLVREKGVDSRVRFHLRDYRDERGRYDRVVSVGMFEHVGVRHYGTYFRKIHDLLTEDGVAVVHFIGLMEPPTEPAPWLNKYIFPGVHAPSLSEVMQALERQRLFLTDVEVWREHYAPTLASWRQRLHANWEQIKARFGEPFCRMFDFYLAGAEAAFRQDTLVVFQLQLARRRETVPPTRDYIERWKDAKRLARTSPVTHAEISQPSSSREASPAARRSVKGERSGPASPSRRG
jgi:cyclopropane-fatty-acyl-phospholipid synthase